MIQNDDEKIFEEAKNIIQSCRNEAAKRLIGQSDVIDAIILLQENSAGRDKNDEKKSFEDVFGKDSDKIKEEIDNVFKYLQELSKKVYIDEAIKNIL